MRLVGEQTLETEIIAPSVVSHVDSLNNEEKPHFSEDLALKQFLNMNQKLLVPVLQLQ